MPLINLADVKVEVALAVAATILEDGYEITVPTIDRTVSGIEITAAN
jgi:hypothetical protein